MHTRHLLYEISIKQILQSFLSYNDAYLIEEQECTFDVTMSHVFTIFCQSLFKVLRCLQLYKRLSTRPSLFGEGKTHPIHFTYNVTVWKLKKGKSQLRLFFCKLAERYKRCFQFESLHTREKGGHFLLCA